MVTTPADQVPAPEQLADLETYTSIVVDTVGGWITGAAAALPNAIVATLVVVGFFFLAGAVATLVRRGMNRVIDSAALAALTGTIARYVVVASGLFVGLALLGLQKTVFSLLAGAGIVGLALGFAFQDLAANLIAGFMIALRKPFGIGDVIETADHMGRVEAINLRNTLIRSFSGQIVVIPNKEVFENPIVNFSKTGTRRVEVEVGVGYDTDLEEATETLRGAIGSLGFLADETGPEVWATAFGGSSIDFKVRFWIDYPGDTGYYEAMHRGVIAIKQALDAKGIEIPFPIRTLDFSETHRDAARIDLRGFERAAGAMDRAN